MNTTLSSSMSTLNSIFPALTATANGKHDETLILVHIDHAGSTASITSAATEYLPSDCIACWQAELTAAERPLRESSVPSDSRPFDSLGYRESMIC